MKKYLWFVCVVGIFCLSGRAEAYSYGCDPKEYAIIYINGILNTEEDAEEGRMMLERKIRVEFGGDNYFGSKMKVRKAYNPSHIGGIGDSISVFIQKAADQNGSVKTLDHDARTMLADLHKEVREGRILFVPHSQGNFYANSLYGWIINNRNGVGYPSVGMYNIASPADVAAYNSTHLLSSSDRVIAGLVGAVGRIRPPNIDFVLPENHPDKLGHNFVQTYLSLGGDRMVEDIKSQLQLLKVDPFKDTMEACIPAPEERIIDRIVSLNFAVLDVGASIVKGIIGGIGKGVAAVFSSSEDTPIQTGEAFKVAEGNTSILKKEESAHIFSPKPAVPNVVKEIIGEIVVPQPVSVQEQVIWSEEDTRRLLLERLLFLTQLSLKEAVASTTLPSFAGGGGIGLQSTPRLAEEYRAPPLSESDEQITIGSVFSIQLPSGFRIASPDSGRLLLTEYYIGKEGESSWVELTNTDSNVYIDTSSVFVRMGKNDMRFPITMVPPRGTVIIRGEGEHIHTEREGEAPFHISEELPKVGTSTGTFVLLEKRVMGEEVLDTVPFGGPYCESVYAYFRSCERMVMKFPGDNPTYWVRAYNPKQHIRDDTASSFGIANYSWNYQTYNGEHIAEQFPGEVPIVNRGPGGYVSGHITIATGKEEYVHNTETFVLVPTEGAAYGGEENTEIEVYGLLRMKNGGGISSVGSPVPSILVKEGGTLIRDPYSFLSAWTIVDGGSARANSIDNFSLLKGKLYITNYQDATLPPDFVLTCEILRNEKIVHWQGGVVYIEGNSCGDIEDKDEAGEPIGIGEYDEFGNIMRLGLLGCSRLLNADGVFVCSPVIEEEGGDGGGSVVGENATTTATSTDPMPPEGGGNTSDGGGGSTASSTDTGLNSLGCFDGTNEEAVTIEQQSAMCGGLWAPRPALYPLVLPTVQRSPREGRMQMVEYYVSATGSDTWIKIGNMMGGATLNMYDSDYVIGDTRKPIPVLSIPPRSHIVITNSSSMTRNDFPALEDIGGTTSKLFAVMNDIEGEGWGGKGFQLLHAVNPREETIILQGETLSVDTCSGTKTPSGSCVLPIRALYWNDPGDGRL